jgi:UDP-N-acetylmuramate--alanine ligase
MNFAAALAMAIRLGVDPAVACTAASAFRGVARRFTERGDFRGSLLIDDYAHLPAEISSTIDAVRSHPALSGRVVAVFQPNRYHRIATMADSYADCFAHADRVVITDVYASGTQKIEGVTGELVVNAIRRAHKDADVVWAQSRADTVAAVESWIAPGDICISMGCGDIESFPDDLRGVVK